nr:VanZ family protein [Sedimentibacter sp.]
MNLIQNLISYLFPGSVVCICYLAILEIIMQMKEEKIEWRHRIILFMLGIYLTIIFSVTVSPVYGFLIKIPDWKSVNIIPFRVLTTMASNPLNFLGNIIMFIPYGCLLVLFSKKCQKIYITTLTGAKLSFLIEVFQLFSSRGSDIDDIILNTIGTICGYCIGKLIVAVIPSRQLKIGILMRKNGKYRKNDTGSINILIVIIFITVITTGFFQQKCFSNTLTNEDNIENDNSSTSIQAKPRIEMNPSTIDVTVRARNAYLLDIKKDIVLYEKESSEQIAPASTTKMVTALTVLDYCDLDEEVVVGEEIYSIASDASRIWLSVGDKLTVKQLLDGLLLPSGNDAAYALAAYTGRKISTIKDISIQDAVNIFITAMNKKAVSLDAIHSNFKSPDGYDTENQYTTAYDLAYIAKEFLENTILSDIASSSRIRDVWINGKDVTYANSNKLINPDSPYYNEDVIGLKTGTSEYAGNCLVSAANINGKKYICVIMGSTEEGRWLDSLELYHSINP